MDQPEGPIAPQPEKELLKWIAPSRPYRPLDRQLFATAVIIAILVSIIVAFAGEWMLIAVIAAIVFAYYMWSTVPPENAEYLVTTRGLRLHSQFYLWQELARWWIEDKMGHKMMIVDAPLSFPRRLHLMLGEQDPKVVEEVVSKYLVMEKPVDTSIDKAGRWLADKFPLQTR